MIRIDELFNWREVSNVILNSRHFLHRKVWQLDWIISYKQICRIKGLRREREREERKKEKKLTTLRRIDGNALLTKGKMLVSRL